MESRRALNQRLNKQLEKRLQFEKLITNLSARFINLPANEIDQQIDNGLKLVVEALQVDRSSLFQFSEDGTEWLITNSFAKEGFETTPRITLQKNFPWVASKIKRGEILRISSLNDLPEEAALDRRSMEQINIKSTLVLPISFVKSLNYILTLGNLKQERSWDSDIIPRLQLIGEVFANALERKKADEKISTFVEQIKTENIILREEINLTHNFENIIGESNQIRYILHEIEKIAPCDAPVLILGETGTGKELIARAIHSLSSRKEKAFITVDCASLPSDLIESELFGHEKGSFTGAHERRIGRFEIANGSTIFLDEIGELPIELQSKLLRIIESGEYERLGSSIPRQVDVRILAATNRNIEEEVDKGNFRQDLFYRLNMLTLTVQSLRERKSDIPLLVNSFVKRYSSKHGKVIERVPKRTIKLLQDYHWPGNVRELKHVIERAIIISEDNSLKVELKISSPQNSENKKMVEIERVHILRVLEDINWRIKGKNGAAEILGLKPSTLRDKMKKLSINRPG